MASDAETIAPAPEAVAFVAEAAGDVAARSVQTARVCQLEPPMKAQALNGVALPTEPQPMGLAALHPERPWRLHKSRRV